MQTRTHKESSSVSPTSIHKKSNGSDGSRSFSVQRQPEINSSPEQEIPSYSRNAADSLIANVMRSMEVREQGEETQGHKGQSEQGAASVAEVVMPKPESPIASAVSVSQALGGIGIQRQCSECAEESAEDGKDFDEMSLGAGAIQTKLTVGAPGDKYEQEADQVAAQVMSMSVAPDSSPQVQRFGEEDNPVQMWSLAQSITPVVQRQVDEQLQMRSLVQRAFQAGGNEASGDLESRLNASRGGGSALSEDVRLFMEPRFGADFSSVRVHTGGEAVQMNRELGAQAFTHGSDVYFGAGKSPGNNELTAHELTHVVQQKSDIRRNSVIQRSPDPLCLNQSVNPASLSDTEIEREIYLIRSWLTQNPESSPDADLLSSSLNALESESSRRGASEQAETSQSSSRHSQSSAAASTPSRSVASSTVEPRSLRESVDPAVMSQAEIETEIQAIRSWLLSHPPSHPEYQLLSQSLSTLEHAASIDGNVQYSQENDSHNHPRSLRESLDPTTLSQDELEIEIQLIRLWLSDHAEESSDRTLLITALQTLENSVSTQGRPPIMWGIDEATRRIYVSVLAPGTTLEAIAIYVCGNTSAVASLIELNGNLPENLPPGTSIQLPSIGTDAALQELNQALASGLVARTDGIPANVSSPDEEMGYRFTYNGAEVTLTQDQMQGLLRGLQRSIRLKAQRLRDSMQFGLEIRNDHVNDTNSVVRGISDLVAGQSVPSEMTWDVPMRGAERILSSLAEDDLTPEMISRNAHLLEVVARGADQADSIWHAYIQGTISGAESTISALETVRDTSFSLAIGIGAAVAAPVVFAAAGGGLLGAGAAVGTGAVGGGLVRGGLDVILPGAQADLSVGDRFNSGFESGALTGGLGAAGGLLAPGVSGAISQRLYGVAPEALTTFGSRATVNTLTGAAIGTPLGGTGAAIANAGALARGEITSEQYLESIGWGSLQGLTFGAAFGFLGSALSRGPSTGGGRGSAVEPDLILTRVHVDPETGIISRMAFHPRTGQYFQAEFNPATGSGQVINMSTGQQVGTFVNGEFQPSATALLGSQTSVSSSSSGLVGSSGSGSSSTSTALVPGSTTSSSSPQPTVPTPLALPGSTSTLPSLALPGSPSISTPSIPTPYTRVTAEGRTDAELVIDRDPTPLSGETPIQAQQRAEFAEDEIAVREALARYNGLPEQAPHIDIAANDAAHSDAHTVGVGSNGRHGPSIPLERSLDANGLPNGIRTIEGRIYGDPPWGGTASFSARWLNEDILNQTINRYIRSNWEQIRSDLATLGEHSNSFDAGRVIGEGYFNANYGQSGLPRAVGPAQTSMVYIAIRFIPGNPPSFYIITTYPSLRGF